MYIIPQDKVLASPLKPEIGFVRTIIASVFNRDVSPDDKLSEPETMTVLGAKLLLDVGHTAEDAQLIFRHYKTALEYWATRLRESEWKPGPLMLVIMDNKWAALWECDRDTEEYFNFKEATVASALGVRPILQVGIALSQLFALVLGDPRDRWYHRTVAEVIAAEQQAGQVER